MILDHLCNENWNISWYTCSAIIDFIGIIILEEKRNGTYLADFETFQYKTSKAMFERSRRKIIVVPLKINYETFAQPQKFDPDKVISGDEKN